MKRLAATLLLLLVSCGPQPNAIVTSTDPLPKFWEQAYWKVYYLPARMKSWFSGEQNLNKRARHDMLIRPLQPEGTMYPFPYENL